MAVWWYLPTAVGPWQRHEDPSPPFSVCSPLNLTHLPGDPTSHCWLVRQDVLSVLQVAGTMRFTNTLILVVQVQSFRTLAAFNRNISWMAFQGSVGEWQACPVTCLSVVAERLIASASNGYKTRQECMLTFIYWSFSLWKTMSFCLCAAYFVSTASMLNASCCFSSCGCGAPAKHVADQDLAANYAAVQKFDAGKILDSFFVNLGI